MYDYAKASNKYIYFWNKDHCTTILIYLVDEMRKLEQNLLEKQTFSEFILQIGRSQFTLYFYSQINSSFIR